MMVAQGGLMVMGAVDTFVVGRVSPLAMGAVALGNTAVGVVIVLGVGLAMGLEPLVAQAHGAHDPVATRRWLAQGWWLALICGVPLMLMAYAMTLIFEPFGVAPRLGDEATRYVVARLLGIGATTFYAVSRGFLSSVEQTRPIVVAVVLANVLNVIADMTLVHVFGLGAVGIGVATSVCMVFMALVVMWAAKGRAPWHLGAPDVVRLRKIANLGWPIGLQLAAEVGIFSVMGLLIARHGEVALAGHQIALSWTSVVFMCAIGLGVGATTRVGMHVGANRTDLARRSGLLAIGLGVAWMASTAAVSLVFREALAYAFAPDAPAVVGVAKTLLAVGAVFAISDGVQAVAAGALRGAGDTKWPFYANVLAHWLVGLPVALWLTISWNMGPAGYWWGLSVGLTIVAVTLVARFAWLSNRPIRTV